MIMESETLKDGRIYRLMGQVTDPISVDDAVRLHRLPGGSYLFLNDADEITFHVAGGGNVTTSGGVVAVLEQRVQLAMERADSIEMKLRDAREELHAAQRKAIAEEHNMYRNHRRELDRLRDKNRELEHDLFLARNGTVGDRLLDLSSEMIPQLFAWMNRRVADPSMMLQVGEDQTPPVVHSNGHNQTEPQQDTHHPDAQQDIQQNGQHHQPDEIEQRRYQIATHIVNKMCEALVDPERRAALFGYLETVIDDQAQLGITLNARWWAEIVQVIAGHCIAQGITEDDAYDTFAPLLDIARHRGLTLSSRQRRWSGERLAELLFSNIPEREEEAEAMPDREAFAAKIFQRAKDDVFGELGEAEPSEEETEAETTETTSE